MGIREDLCGTFLLKDFYFQTYIQSIAQLFLQLDLGYNS